MTKDVCVALDMGNSGGKVLAAAMENGRLEILEEWIIENRVVDVAGALYWDVFSVFRDLKAALRDFSRLGTVRTIGVDSTSGCYAFVKRNGHLCAPPAFGRDLRYQNWERVIQKRMAKRDLYDETGVYPLGGNNICKLACDAESGDLEPWSNDAFLPFPALMQFYLTGHYELERSMAGAAVLMDRDFCDWNVPLLSRLGIPAAILPPIVEPCTFGEKLLPAVARETNCPECRYVHTVEFDSSTAMISAPLFSKDKIYLSMGTTINPGVELSAPLLSDMAYEYRYKNVPVWPGSTMLLSDVPGFFLVAECLKAWHAAGCDVGHGDLVRMASQASTNAFLDLFDPTLCTACGDMPERVRAFCQKTGQSVPETVGQIARVIYESYAVTLAWSIERLCRITGRDDYEDVTIISGGSRNALLCQMIADASGRIVRAGDPHATALGNLLVQFCALGEFSSLEKMRCAAADVCPMTRYEPKANAHLAAGLAFLTQNGFLRA